MTANIGQRADDREWDDSRRAHQGWTHDTSKRIMIEGAQSVIPDSEKEVAGFCLAEIAAMKRAIQFFWSGRMAMLWRAGVEDTDRMGRVETMDGISRGQGRILGQQRAHGLFSVAELINAIGNG